MGQFGISNQVMDLKQIQLPKSKPYFAFLTKAGIINFVRGDLRTNIIQYQEQLNHTNHAKIPKSSITFRKNDG